jgi:hypothetical protein
MAFFTRILFYSRFSFKQRKARNRIKSEASLLVKNSAVYRAVSAFQLKETAVAVSVLSR